MGQRLTGRIVHSGGVGAKAVGERGPDGVAKSHRSRLAAGPVVVLGLVFAMFGMFHGASGQSSTPDPIDPTTGEAALLKVINSIPLNAIENAKDQFPVPYVVIASAGGAAPTIASNRAGAPTRIDADRLLATGRGGHDIVVEVNTELTPTPHLRLNVERLGTGPVHAPNLSVVVAFPFDAFNDEDASPGGQRPNLFFGYQTRGAFDAVTGDYPDGGVAPVAMEYRIIPEVLAGTDHLFQLQMNTTDASNPIRYLGGHFDGDASTGILDAIGMAALADPVPATAALSIDVGESPTSSDPTAATDTEISLGWNASAPTKLTFDYLENEAFPFTTPQFNTSVVFDQMPTQESLALRLDEDDPTAGFTLAHQANAPINKITLLKERSDGLSITGTATQVPTQVDLSTDLDGAYELDVNANTLDLNLNMAQAGGFLSTSDFLGYDVGLLTVDLIDAPDLTATLDPDNDRYVVSATNAGESIGGAGLVLDDGPVPVIDGRLDVNRDGSTDSTDDGAFGNFNVIDGELDLDGSGGVDGSDAGPIAGTAPDRQAVAGRIDVDGDGDTDGSDDGLVSGVALPPAWSETPPHHVLSLADNGSQGTIAARLVNISSGKLDLDGPPVIDGGLDLDRDGSIGAGDDGTLALDTSVIDGAIDRNGDGAISAADTGQLFGTFGPDIVNGLVDVNGDDVVNGSDDGTLTMQTYGIGSTVATPLQAFVNTKSTSRLIPGQDVSATCNVKDIPAAQTTFNLVFPPPSFGFGYSINPPSGQGIGEINCVGHFGTMLVETTFLDLPPVFNWDFDPDEHLTLTAENGTGPNSDRLGSADIHICDDADLDGTCEATDDSGGIAGTGDLLGLPARDARARIDDTPSFEGLWKVGSLTVADGLVTPAAGNFAGTLISGGRLDVNDDGSANDSDDGRFLGKRVIDGRVDVDGDGDVDAADDGTISGTAVNYDTGRPDATLYLDGVQVDVSTKGGLASLPVASAAADDYARFVDKGGSDQKRLSAGVFGIDEFRYSSGDADRTVGLHYGANEAHRLVAEFESPFGGKYFGDYATDLTLDIAKVPASFDLFTDLATELVYTASSGIDSVDLTGTIDDTNDTVANGTDVTLAIDQLPSQVAFNLAGRVTPVAGGALDVNGAGVSNTDDAVMAGVRVIDGLLDLNGDGAVNGSDNGFFVGVPVIAGGLDVNEQGGVTGADNGGVAGATLKMNGGIDSISLDLSSDNKIVKTDYRLVEASLDDVPAQWAVNWGGGRFLLESKNAAGDPSPLGQVSALVSTSNDATENANRLQPFTLDGPTLAGPVLDAAAGASGGCRVNYSQYLQEIDKRYYNAAAASDATDPSAVFERHEDLYCESEQLDPNEDHAIARMGTVAGKKAVDYGSFQFTGFQKVSFVPDADGGHFTLRAPTAGLHPLFAGFEDDDKFTTLQVGNIPDNVEVEIDKSKQVTYDATDDTNASFVEIDVYSGPLPMASDGDPATRVVVKPVGTDPTPTTSYIHTGWNFTPTSGGAFLDNEQELEVLLLTQDGSKRITAGLALEDLLAGYAIDLFSFDVKDSICIIPNLWGGCEVEIPTAWELFEAKAGITNDADGFTPASLATLTPETLTPDPAKPDLAGFLAIYNREAAPAALVGPDLAPGGAEFVPLVTLEEEGFRGASASLSVNLDPLDADILVFSIDVDFDITGKLIFDFWSPENIDFTDDDAIPFIPEVGFVDLPSYTNNSPFHVIPGVESPIANADFDNVRAWVYTFNGWHGFGVHFDPYK